jgi:hypothetical protein
MQEGSMQHSFLSRQPWWLLIGVALVIVALLSLAACAPAGTGASQATATATANQGTLNGNVLAGPTCPVATPDHPCPPKPVPGRQVAIVTPDGKTVATVTTDKNGHFSVMLAPGRYTVKVARASGPFPIQRQPVFVTIVAGKTVSVQILLDTGIR